MIGNPYLAPGCGKCQYDTHCSQGEVCSDQECVPSSQGADTGNGGHPVPPEYVGVAGERYYISQAARSWSQAQYDCMSREGEETQGELEGGETFFGTGIIWNFLRFMLLTKLRPQYFALINLNLKLQFLPTEACFSLLLILLVETNII